MKTARGPIFVMQVVLPLCLLALVAARSVSAQQVVPAPEARASPLELAQLTLSDGTYIMIHYGAPRKRGRDIFGGVVPYGNVWRLGANEATEMTTTREIRFGGRVLPAGTYALFAIPDEEEWTLIVNTNLGQWGAFSYSPKADYLRLQAAAERTDEVHEAFTIRLERADGGADARLVIVWDRTRVAIPIRTTTS